MLAWDARRILASTPDDDNNKKQHNKQQHMMKRWPAARRKTLPNSQTHRRDQPFFRIHLFLLAGSCGKREGNAVISAVIVCFPVTISI